MNRWFSFLVVAVGLAGCGGDAHAPGGTPILPGGGGGTVTPGADGGTVAADAGAGVIRGTLCEASGVVPETCSALITSNLVVTVVETGATTTADDDGTFTLAGAPGMTRATLATAAAGTRFFGTVVSVALTASGGASASLPVLTMADATSIASSNVGGLPAGTGILVVHTSPGVTITEGATPIFYDAGGSFILTTSPPTSTSGTAVVFGVAGTQSLHLANATTSTNLTAIGVANAATFVDAQL